MATTIRISLLSLLLILIQFDASAQSVRLGIPIGHYSGIESAHFSPGNKYIMTTSKDGTTNVWRVSDGLLIYNIPSKEVREGYNWKPSARFNSSGDLMLTTTSDSLVKIYDFAKGIEVLEIDDGVGIRAAQFTPDGKYIVTASSKVVVWDAKTGDKLREVASISIDYSEFSYMRFFIDPEMKYLATSQYFGSVDIWDFSDFAHQRNIETYDEDFFSTDGKYIFSVKDLIGYLGCWEVATGERVYRKLLRLSEIFDLTFSPDNKYFTVDNSTRSSKLYEVETGEKVASFSGEEYINFIEVSPDGSQVAVVSHGGNMELRPIEAETGTKLVGHNEVISFVAFSDDGKLLLSSDEVGHLMLWDVEEKLLLQDLSGKVSRIEEAVYSQDGKLAVICHANGAVKLINTTNGKQLKEWLGSTDRYYDRVSISPDGKYVAFNEEREDLYIYNVEADSLVKRYGLLLSSYGQDKFLARVGDGQWSAVSFASDEPKQIARSMDWDYNHGRVSKDFKYLIASEGWYGSKVMVIDLEANQELYTISAKSLGFEDVRVFAISPDSRSMVIGLRDFNQSEVLVVNIATDEIVGRLDNKKSIESAVFSQENTNLIMLSGGRSDAYIVDMTKIQDGAFVDVKTQPYKASIVSDLHWSGSTPMVVLDRQRVHLDCGHGQMVDILTFTDGSWVHLNEFGQFDASPAAMEKMYWLQGDEVIGFEQLKSQFWIPGLMNKNVLGSYDQKARIEDVRLGPEVVSLTVEGGVLNAHLRKRSGGYGKVSLYVNGKEVSDDIRPDNFDQQAQENSISIDISHLKQLTSNNHITIKANSQDELVQGRGASIDYVDKDKTDLATDPHFYGVVLGVGKYQNSTINLKYSEPDAEAIALSVQMGAEGLFGAERTHMYSFNTGNENKPTKTNIKAIFDEIASASKPEDIVFIYMSGHGVNSGGADGDFFYLTSDALSAKAADYTGQTDHAISTAEFTTWLKGAAALKQVMVIDACGSGKAVENLSETRSLDMSQIKAIDRMKDRTGMFVISGCAADAVSYEASKFGQGLLTYAVLQAMKGAALRENKFVDVNTILQFAKDEVPELAHDINGIQEPQLLIPSSGSFDMGLITAEDQQKIPLQEPKPVFIQSMLMNLDEHEDDLGLTALLDESLSQSSGRGADAKWVFFNSKVYTNGYKVTGTYEVNGSEIIANLRVKGNGLNRKFEIKADGKENFIKQVLVELENL